MLAMMDLRRGKELTLEFPTHEEETRLAAR